MMIRRAALVWTGIVPLAIVNGAIRESLLVPRFGEVAAHQLSSLMLSGAVFFVAWMTIGWLRPASMAEAWNVGGLWLGLTLAFEFLVGHYVFGTAWDTLRADYNLLEGRLWLLVLVATTTAPPVMRLLRGKPG